MHGYAHKKHTAQNQFLAPNHPSIKNCNTAKIPVQKVHIGSIRTIIIPIYSWLHVPCMHAMLGSSIHGIKFCEFSSILQMQYYAAT